MCYATRLTDDRRPSRHRVRLARLTHACLAIGFVAAAQARSDEAFAWPRSVAAEVDISADMPDALRATLAKNTRLLSFGLVRGGKLVVEHYQNGAACKSYGNIASATKWVLALLVGIAIDRGAIVGGSEAHRLLFRAAEAPHRPPGASAHGSTPAHHFGRMGGQVDPHAARTRDRRARPADGFCGGQGLPVRQCILSSARHGRGARRACRSSHSPTRTCSSRSASSGTSERKTRTATRWDGRACSSACSTTEESANSCCSVGNGTAAGSSRRRGSTRC